MASLHYPHPCSNRSVGVEVLSGYLYKRGVLNTKWQCRWVSVTQTSDEDGTGRNCSSVMKETFWPQNAHNHKITLFISKLLRIV